MMLSKTKKILFGLGIYFCSTIAPNYLTHSLRAIRDSEEAKNYPFFEVQGNRLTISREHRLLMEHQRATLEELTNPWILIPGSFLWRKVERRDLGKRIYQDNNFPLHRA